jgi:DNA repair protein RadC
VRNTYTINDLPAQERPRERLANLGPQALSIPELIAIILGRGVSGIPITVISQDLLTHFGSLSGLQEASLEDMQKIKGLGFAKACQIKASLELARRLDSVVQPLAIKNGQKSASRNEIHRLIRNKIGSFSQEHFIVLSLDTRSKILAVDTVFIGTLTSSLVHPRETLEAAVRRHAASFIIAHNHPSGDPEPSEEDTKVTKLIFEAGQVMGITMLDHLIIGHNSHFSFRDNKVVTV